MNVHNHSIWPPPGACNFNHPAPVVRHGALLQQLVRDALIFPVVLWPREAIFPVTDRSDKE